MTEYEKIYDFENLYQAFRIAARGKHTKHEIITFELDLAQNLWSLYDAFESRTYKIGGYHHFTIYDPKVREIQALAFRDRVVQHSICDNVLEPYFEKRLIYDCAACRSGKGIYFAVNRLSGFMCDFYKEHGTNGYFLKIDVRKYFDSIDHEVLKYLLRKFPDKDVRKLLYGIIDSYNKDTGIGLPMGNQTSQWFSLYYLDKIDRLIKEQLHIKYYSRYMDDMILLHESKDYLKQCLEKITETAQNILHLSFNEKTQIFPVSEGADYLGWHFYLTDSGKVIRRLRTSSKKRFKRRLKSFEKKYSAGEITLTKIRRSLASYRGHLLHGHTYRLRKHISENFILHPPPQEE